MKYYSHQCRTDNHQSQKGVALVAALFVLMVLTILVIAVLADVQGELKMSGTDRNSEKALKLAELGVQIARATILQGTISGELASVDGFADGGYFFTSLGSGLPGNEKWEQWHYSAELSGNNVMSEITTPIRPVWMKESQGTNGSWDGTNFTLNNIYSIIAGGAYFPIEFGKDTALRAVDEYTGKEGVKFDPNGKYSWKGDDEGDKTLQESIASSPGYNKGFAMRMSPMASYTNLSSIPSEENPRITQQTIYFTYSGDSQSGSATYNKDTTSTVRLRAINSLCNDSSDTKKTNTLWEFDTGIHGVGTAPAFFDPTPDQPGDEVIYFAVADSGSVDLRERKDIERYPNQKDQPPEGIYIFAIVDETSAHSGNAGKDECSKVGHYRVKWAHPFPDPDVADWTDYPTEQLMGTDGQNPPYVRRSSDMEPFLPEDDVLFDYRYQSDSKGFPTRRHVRGNLYMRFDPQSVSPVVLNVLYELDDANTDGTINITNQRKDTLDGAGDPADPLIELYLVYAAHSMVKRKDPAPYNEYESDWNRKYGLKKRTTVQTRIIALRDRLDGSCDKDGTNCTWDWDSTKSRFPTFKWSYRVPSWDPKRDDQRPWNGYGEFVWDNWFEQQIAPMIGTASKDQDGTAWGSVKDSDSTKFAGGKRDLYSLVFAAAESLGFVDGAADTNTKVSPPSTSQGSPVNFGSDKWSISHLLTMAVRDTWDDYMKGYQTNPLYGDMVKQNNPFAVSVRSNPVEPYWTHRHDGIVCETDGAMTHEYYPGTSETVITYTALESTKWAGNKNKIGFPRPYVWSEALWTKNVKGSTTRGLDLQGWEGSGISTDKSSLDADLEGETSAFCRDCLDGDGLIVQVFNHDLSSNIEDLRVHGINARTGKHVWDYHMPAVYVGDYFNATPGIANGRVFIAYASQSGTKKGAYLQALDADSGEPLQQLTIDKNADALLIPPTIANGALYVGTYDFNGTKGDGSKAQDDKIRIYAFSPVLRMFSTGIYPMAYTNETTIPDFTVPIDGTSGMPRAERKIQVWITGAGSKWEELRDNVEPEPTPAP